MQCDPALCYLEERKSLCGFCAVYVDNLLPAGDNVFKKLIAFTKYKIKMPEEKRNP